MTTTPGNASSNLPGRPPVVDLATWQAAREELLVREKAHTREGDAIAAARRRLPMVELDGAVEVAGVDGPVPFVHLFEGRDELVVYKHMWYDGAPYQGQCEGCTFNVWHVKDAVYLNARGVSFAVLTSGPWDEVAPYVEFMGYTQPWYSVRGVEAPVGGGMGHIVCFLRDGDRVFLTYSTTGRGNEPVDGTLGLLDMTPYGRSEAWEFAYYFWVKVFALTFALGVVSGVTMSFQFGTNWSFYSHFVGDIFGAPLAFEALIAFFFESTFIGLWIFGWDKLPKKIHLACMWMVSIGTILSAAMLARWSLGRADVAVAIEGAVAAALDAGWRTPDLARESDTSDGLGVVGTTAFASAVIERLDVGSGGAA